jgi:hypothetical protein
MDSDLCTVTADIEKEAERKEQKGAGASDAEKAPSGKAAEAKARKTKTNELLNNIFDGVFWACWMHHALLIHLLMVCSVRVRVCRSVFVRRDADSGIRADRMREMGIWMKQHLAHFLKDTYLRYDDWVLSDTVSGLIEYTTCGDSQPSPGILLSCYCPTQSRKVSPVAPCKVRLSRK